MKYCDTCRTTYPNDFSTCPKDQTVLRTTSELMQGMIIREKYEILGKIGAGGMAAVYRAKHLAFNEIRAIKVVSARLLDDETFIKRFKTEAIVTRKLQHPNAVRVDDLDTTDDGRPYIVMELVQGRDLRKVIHDEGPFSVARSLDITRQTAAALGAAHALGITHRDIKPDNILLVPQPDGTERVKVLDFGIAKVREGAMDMGAGYTATKTGMVVGTPQYISPEQAMGKHGEAIDGRSDLYSLGVVLYEMLTGQLPFDSDTPVGLLLQHIQAIPTPPHRLRPDLHIPESLSMILMKLLEKDRENRIQSAGELIEALESLPAGFEGTSVMGSEDVAAAVTPRAVQGTAVGITTPTTIRPAAPLPKPPPKPAPPPARVAPPPSSRPAPAAPAPPRAAEPYRPRAAEPEERSWARPAIIGVVVLLLVAGGGVYFMQSRKTADVPVARTDADIQADVNRVLSSSELTRQATVQGGVNEGVVTLTGTAESQFASEMADGLVRGMDGVRVVRNQITVKPLPTSVASSTDTQSTSDVQSQPAPTSVAAPPRARVAEPPGEGAGVRGRRERARQLLATAQEQVRQGNYEAAIQSLEEAQRLEPANNFVREALRRARRAQ
ncbi:MAG: serine/threonine protein kinase, partial [Terriglobales bacterium]